MSFMKMKGTMTVLQNFDALCDRPHALCDTGSKQKPRAASRLVLDRGPRCHGLAARRRRPTDGREVREALQPGRSGPHLGLGALTSPARTGFQWIPPGALAGQFEKPPKGGQAVLCHESAAVPCLAAATPEVAIHPEVRPR